jgi:glycosyltransferase involved in cell wall biosynthesis
MLREALASVRAARPDQLILVDDGSDFDVRALAVEYGVDQLLTAPPVGVQQRLTVPRHGARLNDALQLVTTDIVTYLCDDDLHAVGWYEDLRFAWPFGLARGEWSVFQDGTPPTFDDPPCQMDARQLTTGNFAHAASLIPTGAARWPTDVLNCLDHHFLVRLNARGRRHGASMFGAPCVGFAGWRREHALVVNNFSDGRGYTAGYRAVLEAGMLEAAR